MQLLFCFRKGKIMRIIDLIEKKKTGQSLTENEIKFFINSLMDNSIEDYQVSALLMAIYFNGMDIDETTYLTKYMAESGQTLDLSDISDNIVDKHSTGGVGDKITLMFMPIVAAAGVPVAKLSGRGLGHTGGTIDKLESIPGFQTNIEITEFKQKINEIGAALASQTLSLAPADGKLYALRDVTSTVDVIPLIASSVVSKKVASGANHIILDVKYGSGAFIKTAEKALELSQIMVDVGKKLGRKISAVISSMDQPLGRAVGNSLEIVETIEFLKGNMCSDLAELTFELSALVFLELDMFKTLDEARNYARDLVSSGKALAKFKEIIIAQGGGEMVIEDYSLMPQAAIKLELKCDKDVCYVENIDALKIAKACKVLGAGREKKSDSIDYSVGVYLNKKYGEKIENGEVFATIYANKNELTSEAQELVISAYKLSCTKPEDKSIIYKVI